MTRTFAELTTLKVGGAIADFRQVENAAELAQIFLEADEEFPPFLIGGGSNLLASDEGYAGVVLQLSARGIKHSGDHNGRVLVRAEGGENWDDLVRWSVEQGLAGIEALSGIPGSVGAAPVQNIGAYGQELAEVLHSIEFFDLEAGEVLTLGVADLGFGYRTSVIKRGRRGVVLSVTLALTPGSAAAPVRYQQLANALDVKLGFTGAALTEVREAVLALRRAKGMVLDANDPDSVSAGSFFTNPYVSSSFARGLPEAAPRWETDVLFERDAVWPLGHQPEQEELVDYSTGLAADQQPTVKLSAAWLIEQAGIRKGYRLPGSRAAVSSKHTLALTNTGGATAEEIAQLARFVQSRVAAEFGVNLQPEPTFLGVWL